MDIHTLMRCHLGAFAYYGGHTREILYDNMKTIILHPRTVNSSAIINPEFADFAGYYGYRVLPCAPYRAQTKGKVERVIGYVKDNFLAGRIFASLEEMNRQALLWCETVNGKVHGSTGKIPGKSLPGKG